MLRLAVRSVQRVCTTRYVSRLTSARRARYVGNSRIQTLSLLLPSQERFRIRRQELSTNSNSDKDSDLNDKSEDKAERIEDKPESSDAQEKENAANDGKPNSANTQPSLIKSAVNMALYLIENIRDAHMQLFAGEKESSLVRKVEQASSFRRSKKEVIDGEEDDIEKESPSEIVVVKGNKNPWEAMQERLQESPLIKEILRTTKNVTKAAANTDIGKQVVNASQSVRDKIEDAREFWETSQNPIVYAVAGALENLTAETEEGMAVREIKKLDPKFIKEEWEQEIRLHVAPKLIKAQLQGDLKTLKPWMGEAVYNKLAADIRIRKADGLVFDSTILNLDENRMTITIAEHIGPVIMVIYMVQQINCIKNREGDIIEGAEDQIRAKFYCILFRQLYDDEKGIVRWEVIDYILAGDTPYI